MTKKQNYIGIPLAVQNAMYSITGVVSQSVVNSFGRAFPWRKMEDERNLK